MSAEELDAIEKSIDEERTFRAGERIVQSGQPLRASSLLVEGWVSRETYSSDGARQILGLHIAGDFLDLHGFPLGKLDHNVVAMSAVRIANVPHAAIDRMLRVYPHLTKLLWFSTLVDAAIHREWVFRNSCLSAIKRVGHLFCEIAARLECVGLSDGRSFTIPLTQIDIADACGLTPVHVNRVVRELREAGLLAFQRGQAQIPDPDALRQFSEYDPSYLYHD